MLINELSKRTQVTPHTIRFYEKYGLIKGKRKEEVKSNNYLHYDEEAVYKLGLIRDAKLIGFTLAEIKKLIDAWFNKRISKTKKLEIISAKSKEIDDKIKQLKQMKKQIEVFKKEVEEFDC
jgi:DNA-binding transcriptional MerR regulator